MLYAKIPVLCRNEAPAVTLEVLSSLASVRRFDMAVMFMSSAEKNGTSLSLLDVLLIFKLPFFHLQVPAYY